MKGMFATGRYDALVVGARCAGAATAMLMARRGMRVLAVDRGGYGTDTLSTHALMRGGVLQLHRWGVLPRLAETATPPVRSVTFHYGGEDPVVVPVRPADGVDALYAPRRTVLDALLADAAAEAGAEVRHGVTVTRLCRDDGGRVTGVVARRHHGPEFTVRARFVVGADGARSGLAAAVGATAYAAGRRARS
jgi:flavin-dependent dehydrogenase